MSQFAPYKILYPLFFLLLGSTALAQKPPASMIRDIGGRVQSLGGGGATGGGGVSDSLSHRNHAEDSVTVLIRFLDSNGLFRMDSSINDFTSRFPIPATHMYLGNTGSATRSLLYEPESTGGFDPGFHAYDVYKWSLDRLRFYNVTRPYTELNYQLATRSEQIIEVLHTQNIRSYWNFSFNYRLINAPGVYRNQQTNHNNYAFTSSYQAPSKRYNNYVALLGNSLQASENGGLVRTKDLDSVDFIKDRFLIPTMLGGDPSYDKDFFSTSLYTGNRYREFNFVVRQQYDLGKKDSLVTDSTVIKLFYPRLRFEHTFNYGKYSYTYQDLVATNKPVNTPDSAYYFDNYGVYLPSYKSISFRDSWKEISNDFSIYQFPDARNLRQYIKVGMQLQLLRGNFFWDSIEKNPSGASLHNLILHGEYRNKTKNQKWDMVAFGNLWASGYNAGDYHAYVSLGRLLSTRIGSLMVGFESINRSPSFIYDSRSGFYFDDPTRNFNKENTTHLFGSASLPRLRLQLGADYYLISNYLYLTDFSILRQETTLFNLLRLSARKDFRVGKSWHLNSEVYLQQKTGEAQINLPLIFMRHRFMYEGKLGFRNLNIAMGMEVRYNTPYKADNYSPVLGKFFYQDSLTLSNLPDIHAFLHFRIRSFRAYIRAENLNTVRFLHGFGFTNNSLVAPAYAMPGLVFRFGIYWGFVN